MKRCALALFLALAAGAAAAATPVYRCGKTYSQTPCPDGQLIESADPRTAAQRAEARRVAERQKRMAARMERDRASQAASAPGAASASVAAPAPVPAKAKKKARKPAHAASQPGLVFITPRPAQK